MFIFSSWFLLAILTGLASNSFNFFSRYILRGKEDATAFGWYFELIRFLFFAALAFYDWHLIINPQSVIIFICLALTEFMATYWYMKMHLHNHLSVSTILSRTRMIWVPILAFFLLKENLKLYEYIGIAIVFLGVSIVSTPKKLFVDKGAFYANASAFMVALNIIFIVMLFPYASNSVILSFCAFPSIFLFPIFMKDSKKRIKNFFKKGLLLKTFAIGLNIATIYLLTLAFRIGEVSKINAVYQGMLILSVVAGIIFLRERKNIGRKLIGAIITIVGVVLLSFY